MNNKKPILSPLIAFFVIIGVWIGAGLQWDKDDQAQHHSKNEAKVYYKL
ncbi:hypothetical protein [Fictibacillus fluitans]|uniref:Uncharacterized protein n=1 Tax=Fictibacillus fluitans TaxID=3058422 RepID=A0ABT8I054_9BACL|nr:hypothetical protein [Fictibacillus sp. NE201]MDN4526339.1 hypothetical protein [Fictibacillus sp. NE201]